MNISVIMSTYNRSKILNKTLGNFCRLDLDGINVTFVLVDNNCVDDTKKVIESYKDRLSIKYLSESKPGKNCALNKVLDEVELGDLVVFTDDDVNPDSNWLKEVLAISERHLDIDVFGGRIYSIWPDNTPKWFSRDYKKHYFSTFPHHDFEGEQEYPKDQYPLGANFWVRSTVFAEGRRFEDFYDCTRDHKKRVMGGETAFLHKLKEDGYRILFSPNANIGHYITEDQVTLDYIMGRAATRGRSLIYRSKEFSQKNIYMFSKIIWVLAKYLVLIKHTIILFFYKRCKLTPDSVDRICRRKGWQAYASYYIENHNDIFDYFESESE